MSLDLTPEEEKAILEARASQKTKEQLAYEADVKSAEDTYQRELAKVNKRNHQTRECFKQLQEEGLADIRLVSKQHQVAPLSFQREKLKLGDYKVTNEEWLTIELVYTAPNGEEQSDVLSFEKDNGKYKVSLPYRISHQNRYYIVKTAAEKIKEHREFEVARFEKANKFQSDLKKLVAKFRAESPEGTEFSTRQEYKHYRHTRGGVNVNLLYIKYPNENEMVLRVYSDMSYAIEKMVDKKRDSWKADEWMNELKG